MLKACSSCHQEKPLTAFHKDSRQKSGLRPECSECTNARRRACYRKRVQEGRQKPTNRKRDKAADRLYQMKYRQKHRAKDLIRHAKTRATKKGVSFDLDKYQNEIQARIDLGVCEMTGTSFNLSQGRTYSSPSLDRINPSEGYIYKNIRIVCHLMNCCLGDWGEETLKTVMKNWIQ